MTGTASFIGGNGVGLTWTDCFASGDLTSLADSKSVLSSATGVANGTALDTMADFSAEIAISSSTPRAGAYIGIWLAGLLHDGTTYGDGQLTAGSQATYLPPWSPDIVIPLTNQAETLMAGMARGIILPPGTFNFIAYNFSNVTFSATAGNNHIKYRTYNLNLNR